ncbi:disulfide bond formation protein B [Legionella taurinensis]|uniref:Disulfide bond formation protein B n=1 Tax=Legionella taurinensis TaxID=70611 RepID=A0A3A5L6Y2_9GAMM|nr:disulfide bond formation protein B [Legionella taurinensis]MDX1838708.1 disulfide bond formation protein B [Legionella taurinensis]PUT38789.1 disulfide bond formation protein B [Legionella taurinensis]PUT40213.1 disulfide bond formation protein B [Legionella taurinensis]PUT42519.1 disulfide bond formation protein B [Legionella taurinensis]PUT45939.1 disulfide bond formation protein B [Legionella taurinensis]
MNSTFYRYWQLLLVFVTLFVLAASFYFQLVKDLTPCPLCLMQRFSVMALLAFTMMSWFWGMSRGGKYIAGLIIAFAAAGFYFAARQIWLQSLPPEQTPACLPGLDVLIRYFPWQDVVHALLLGAGDCAEITWSWLGLSMPAWSALYFFAMILAGVINWLVLSKR